MLKKLMSRGIKWPSYIFSIFNQSRLFLEKFQSSPFSLNLTLVSHFSKIRVSFFNKFLLWCTVMTFLIYFLYDCINLFCVMYGFSLLFRVWLLFYISKLSLELLCELLIYLFFFTSYDSWLDRTYILKNLLVLFKNFERGIHLICCVWSIHQLNAVLTFHIIWEYTMLSIRAANFNFVFTTCLWYTHWFKRCRPHLKLDLSFIFFIVLSHDWIFAGLRSNLM